MTKCMQLILPDLIVPQQAVQFTCECKISDCRLPRYCSVQYLHERSGANKSADIGDTHETPHDGKVCHYR